jgi:tRNA-2-methylthio-N6-dimethylallyladenosine synthase
MDIIVGPGAQTHSPARNIEMQEPLTENPTYTERRMNRQTVHVLTWGCQMNVYDSTRMVEAIAPLGFSETDHAAEADLVILNTCHIREHATEKVFSELGRLRLYKEARARKGKRMILALAGCVAQAEGEEILARAPYVDLIVGPQSYHYLPRLVLRVQEGETGIVATDFPPESKFAHLPIKETEANRRKISAFLSIQEGCDKFCSFCVVPYTRGAEFSRPAAEILVEARTLLARGAREIVLLGQNVNAWHGEGLDGRTWKLGRLIRALAELPGLVRLRYTTSHPRDMDADLISAHAEVGVLAPFLHLPVQSGSDRILSAMNRRHSRADYLRQIERIRKARPDIALSSDFIVGYPGETDADFEETLSLIKSVGFAQGYAFKFSPRPGTPAANEAAQTPEAVKNLRLKQLQAILREQQQAFAGSSVGRVLPVLFTDTGRHPGQILGRTHYMQPVHVTGPTTYIGAEVPVRIEHVHPNSLSGVVVDTSPSSEEQNRA